MNKPDTANNNLGIDDNDGCVQRFVRRLLCWILLPFAVLYVIPFVAGAMVIFIHRGNIPASTYLHNKTDWLIDFMLHLQNRKF